MTPREKWQFIVLFVLFILLTGCMSSLMSQAPVTQQVARPGSPQAVYQQAVVAYTKMGGQVQYADAQARVIAGVVHQAVQLNVRVDDDSIVYVTGHLLPGKLVVGSVTEIQDYVALLQQEGGR